MQVYKYNGNIIETKDALANLVGLASDSEEFKEVLTSDEVEIIEAIIPEHNKSIHQLDFTLGQEQDGKFVYGIKTKTRPIIFGVGGVYKKHGWSEDAIEVPLPLADFVDKEYRLVDGQVVPPSIEYLRKQLLAATFEYADEKRRETIGLTGSSEEEREWWSTTGQAALRVYNDQAFSEDLEDFRIEASARGDITAEALAEKAYEKARKYAKAGKLIQGLSKNTKLALEDTPDDVSQLFGVLAEKKALARSEFHKLETSI